MLDSFLAASDSIIETKPPQALVWSAERSAEDEANRLLSLAYQYEAEGKLAKATAVYLTALHQNPNFIEFQFGASLVSDGTRNQLSASQWDGQAPLQGKRLLVYAEKGLGDTIQFCRFLPLLKGSGARVYFKPQKYLYEMLRQVDLGVELIAPHVPLSSIPFDYSSGLLSLPALLRVDPKSLPGTAGYLNVDKARVEAFSQHFSSDKIRVGLVWSGDNNHPHNPDRSIFLPLLLSAFRQLSSVELYSLQVGEASKDLGHPMSPASVTDLAPLIRDNSFLDSLALIANLDLLVSVDTSICHAASALVSDWRPEVWILLPARPDLRWAGVEDHSLWYDAPLLLRQRRQGDWEPVIKELRERLSRLQKSKKEA